MDTQVECLAIVSGWYWQNVISNPIPVYSLTVGLEQFLTVSVDSVLLVALFFFKNVHTAEYTVTYGDGVFHFQQLRVEDYWSLLNR